jgi:aminopeptidase
MTPQDALLDRYARVIVRIGANVQPGQCVVVTAELIHRAFAHRVARECYAAGAKRVVMQWIDPHIQHSLLAHAPEEGLDTPAYELARFQQMADERWASIYLEGEEVPNGLDDINPDRLRRFLSSRRTAGRVFSDARMANRAQWTIAALPTPAWAARIFPDMPETQAVDALWQSVLTMTRADREDPVAEWQALTTHLRGVGARLEREGIERLHFFDPAPAADGRPSTDLTIGLTAQSFWETAAFVTPEGLQYVANLPSEEVFTTPHCMRADGYVRTSRPIYPLDREVRGAYFRFEDGECVEASAEHGDDVLRAFLETPGVRRLGEVALVDVRSPVAQAGRTFYNTLYDENAACHIAFGDALDMCVRGVDGLSRDEKRALGMNQSDAHEDFMIGTATMNVDGLRADGARVPVMRAGMFTET